MPKNLYLREGIYWARFKVDGVEYRQSLRTRSERVAEKRMNALRESIEDQAVYGISGPVTWPAAVVSWNENIGDAINARTFHRYATSLRQMRGHLDHLAVQEITVDTLRDMIKARRRAGVKNATIRRDLTALSSVLNHAIDEGWIADNPAAALNRRRLVPEKTVPIVLPQPDSIARVFPNLPERIRDLCEFTRETGLRMTEATGLSHAHLDRVARVITIKGKRSKVRAVPLTAAAEAIIDRQPRYIGKPWVFWQGAGEPLGGLSSRIGGYMRRAARKAAQEKREFHPFSHHDFRHLFAVEYLRHHRGSIYDLQRELGHDSITTTERYLVFLTPEEAKVAMHGGVQKAAQEQRFAGLES
jgi:integrase/recombinase XerD